MKSKLPLLVLGAAAMLLGGCVVQCLHPLFAEAENISVPWLVGTWEQREDTKVQGKWTFEADDKHYKLAHTDEKGSRAVFQMTAGRLGTNVFLCTQIKDPAPGWEMNDFAAVHLLPVYSFARARRTEAGLTLAMMNLEWLMKLLGDNPKALSHVMRKVDNEYIPLITASTEELQKFVTKYAEDEKAFGNEIKLVRKGAK
jgi:hypothetical protein